MGKSNCRNDCDGYGKTTVQVRLLKEGTAMVAEAGPELLSMVNGKAVVTPLSGSAKNQAMENAGKGGGGYVQNVNITSPKALSPYEIARQTRLQTRSMILAVQRG